jgi:hypothetical protein
MHAFGLPVFCGSSELLSDLARPFNWLRDDQKRHQSMFIASHIHYKILLDPTEKVQVIRIGEVVIRGLSSRVAARLQFRKGPEVCFTQFHHATHGKPDQQCAK